VKLLDKQDIRIERLPPSQAAYIHSDGANPEEESLTKIIVWAKTKKITSESGVHLFGRNTYPTDKPEPHGYEYYLTLNEAFNPEEGIKIEAFAGGLFAVLRFKNLFTIKDAWTSLMNWAKENGHQEVGVIKTENGWVNSGFEELINWEETIPPSEWIFDIWLQIKQK
jgi:DNA gyrase inhibitor GyrI